MSKEVEVLKAKGLSEPLAREKALELVAPPGKSEHQLGLAVDLLSRSFLGKGLLEGFSETPEGRWLSA